MTRDDFNIFCGGLRATSHVIQWGGSDVWKVGGKVFAISGWNNGKDAFTFKASDMGFEVLSQMPGLRGAPYMASRGLKWIQHYADPGLSDGELKEHLLHSYDMIVAGLTKKKRAELGMSAGA